MCTAGPPSVFAFLGSKQQAIKAAAVQTSALGKRKAVGGSVGDLPQGKVNRQGGVDTPKSCSQNCRWHRCKHESMDECVADDCGIYGMGLNQHRAWCPNYNGRDKEKLQARYPQPAQ
jgi:hypothetical protein